MRMWANQQDPAAEFLRPSIPTARHRLAIPSNTIAVQRRLAVDPLPAAAPREAAVPALDLEMFGDLEAAGVPADAAGDRLLAVQMRIGASDRASSGMPRCWDSGNKLEA